MTVRAIIIAAALVALPLIASRRDKETMAARPFDEFHISYSLTPYTLDQARTGTNVLSTLTLYHRYTADFMTRESSIAGRHTEIDIDVVRRHSPSNYTPIDERQSFLYEAYAARIMYLGYQHFPFRESVVPVTPYLEVGGGFGFNFRMFDSNNFICYDAWINPYLTNGAALAFDESANFIGIRFNDGLIRVVNPYAVLIFRTGMIFPLLPWFTLRTGVDFDFDIGTDLVFGVNLAGLFNYRIGFALLAETLFSMDNLDLKFGVTAGQSYRFYNYQNNFFYPGATTPFAFTFHIGVNFKFSLMLFEL
ncbi:MAG: hypothetical protein AABZ39_09050 [Spirochaetota bacterium]